MALSAFGDKSAPPDERAVERVLGKAYPAWSALIAAVGERIDPLSGVWGFTSANAGWGLRLRHKERVILHMTPQEDRFLVSFALGEKAAAAAHQARWPPQILETIDSAPRYAEGRGVRFEVTSRRLVPSLAALARLKLEN